MVRASVTAHVVSRGRSSSPSAASPCLFPHHSTTSKAAAGAQDTQVNTPGIERACIWLPTLLLRDKVALVGVGCGWHRSDHGQGSDRSPREAGRCRQVPCRDPAPGLPVCRSHFGGSSSPASRLATASVLVPCPGHAWRRVQGVSCAHRMSGPIQSCCSLRIDRIEVYTRKKCPRKELSCR
jgi:hypothetical protein